MVLCPFGGFFLPLVHRGSVLGFWPFGFLAGPGWFHGLGESGVHGVDTKHQPGSPHPLARVALNHALKMVVFTFMVFGLWKF
jgi:hypothetical protein